jgi:hypothetical protein
MPATRKNLELQAMKEGFVEFSSFGCIVMSMGSLKTYSTPSCGKTSCHVDRRASLAVRTALYHHEVTFSIWRQNDYAEEQARRHGRGVPNSVSQS